MRAAVFSGTSEGKEIAAYLSCKKIETSVFTATKYGREVMDIMPYVTVYAGRLDTEGMCRAICKCDFVIDATHPYAVDVTKNIKAACEKMNVEYIRLLRDEIKTDDTIQAENTEKAVEMLKKAKGNIFISIGSKELHKFNCIDNYTERLAVRVLPVDESIIKCQELGFKNVLYKKGPFSYAENIEDFSKFCSDILVTKNSGKAGGFQEKINAAKSLGMKIVVISRPIEENGLSMNEVKKIVDRKNVCIKDVKK